MEKKKKNQPQAFAIGGYNLLCIIKDAGSLIHTQSGMKYTDAVELLMLEHNWLSAKFTTLVYRNHCQNNIERRLLNRQPESSRTPKCLSWTCGCPESMMGWTEHTQASWFTPVIGLRNLPVPHQGSAAL